MLAVVLVALCSERFLVGFRATDLIALIDTSFAAVALKSITESRAAIR